MSGTQHEVPFGLAWGPGCRRQEAVRELCVVWSDTALVLSYIGEGRAEREDGSESTVLNGTFTENKTRNSIYILHLPFLCIIETPTSAGRRGACFHHASLLHKHFYKNDIGKYYWMS
jgi:hypothetical protein